MRKAVYDLTDLQNWRAVTGGENPPLRLSVFGDPVAHSKSPPMHDAALEACGIAARYCRLHIRPEELESALRMLGRENFIGTNVTIPHKAAALALVDEASDHARRAGGVNTIRVEGGKLIGFSTDGPGLARAICEEFGAELRDLRVLILGAGGGAGRAIAMQCAAEKCLRLVLVNRTVSKLREWADELGTLMPAGSLAIEPWERPVFAAQIPTVDLIINCSPVGMKSGDASPIASEFFNSRLMVYDTVYTAARTPFLQAADEAGARGANGLSMLLHQGALSFEIWFGREAPLDAMRAGLMQAVAAA
jgi:shikimate dehydrogenase